MHHKNKKSPNASGKNGNKDPGYEAMQRLRYLNKKPLCLQYNVLTRYAKRNRRYSTKKQEQSFVVIIAFGLIRLIHWLATVIQKEVSDFVTKPAHELYPTENRTIQAPEFVQSTEDVSQLRRRSYTSKRCLPAFRRDYGRTARMLSLQDRHASLCTF